MGIVREEDVPFVEGRFAGRLEMSPAINPYPKGTKEFAAWREGWLHGVIYLVPTRDGPTISKLVQ